MTLEYFLTCSFRFILPGLCLMQLACSSPREGLGSQSKEQIVMRGTGTSTDVYPQLQRALDQGVRIITLEKGRFYLSKPLHVKASDVRIEGKGRENTTIYTDGNALIKAGAPSIYKEIYEGEIPEGSDELNLRHADQWWINALIHISAPHGMPEVTSDGYSSHHTGRIKSVQNNKVILDRPIEIPFKSNITISIHRSAHLSLGSITLEADNTPYIVEIRNRSGVFIEDVTFTTPRKNYMGEYRAENPQLGVSAIGAFASQNIEVRNCHFDHIWYGLMAHEGCFMVSLSECLATDSRHINNNGVGTDLFRVVDCRAERCEGGFDSHHTGLTTTFINCVDTLSRFYSKFRGRRDSIINCYFDNGIELDTDAGLYNKHDQDGKLYKVVLGSVVLGSKIEIKAANVHLLDCMFFAPVVSYNLTGQFVFTNSVIDLTSYSGAEASGLTIGNAPPEGYNYHYVADSIELIGPGIGSSPMEIGIYLPMRSNGNGYLGDIDVSGFTKGIVLYGGEESKEKYKKLEVRGLSIKDCDYGIFQQDFEKQMKHWDVKVTDCRIADNKPGRIKNATQNR